MVKKVVYNWTGRQYYASKAWNRDVVLLAKRNLKEVDFDTFVCVGLSGLVIAAKLSHLMDKKLFVVRKERQSTHSSNMAEGEIGAKWIFIDDFISSGKSKSLCVDAVRKYDADTIGVGEYLYGQYADNLGFKPWNPGVR